MKGKIKIEMETEQIKINSLEIENVKRVKAVKLAPSSCGLTVIGGKNKQGKTSVLDSIAWALGGKKYQPTQPTREGSVVPGRLKLVLSNGLVVERNGVNGDLKVTDPEGKKAGQTLLNDFIEELALNLPKFMNSSSKEKADILLNIIGVGVQLHQLEKQENEIYNNRRAIGQIADQKCKFAKEMNFYSDVPKAPVSAKNLIDQQQAILAQNGENARKREKVKQYEWEVSKYTQSVSDLKQQLSEAETKLNEAKGNFAMANKDVIELFDESTEELERNIEQIDELNRKVRANLDKDKAEQDAQELRDQYDEQTSKLESVRRQKMELLDNADLPLSELSVKEGEIIYKGQQWDNMSGSEQLMVATAIVKKLNPKCGFVLIDKLEQMDLDTMNEFGAWLEEQGLQAIATRVSTSADECSLIIQDGYVLEEVRKAPVEEDKPKWKAGEF